MVKRNVRQLTELGQKIISRDAEIEELNYTVVALGKGIRQRDQKLRALAK